MAGSFATIDSGIVYAFAPPSDRPRTVTERLNDIEIKLAHLESALEELSNVIIAQQATIDRLQNSHEMLRQRIVTLEPSAAPPEDEKPPHY
jgi:uncharacterized coiled-coil protein SlyX